MTGVRRYVPVAALSLFLIGILLVVVAYVQASSIPHLAHEDYGRLIQRLGGSLSSTATYPDTYRAMSAQVRVLQNAYLGGGGLILMALGGVGLLRQDAVWERWLRP
jgi:hypothetical protein